MSINMLYAAFRKIAISKLNIAAVAKYSTQRSGTMTILSYLPDNYGMPYGTEPTHRIKFMPGTLNIDSGISIHKNIKMPVVKILPLYRPVNYLPIKYDFPILEKSIDLPTNEKIIEKQAVRMIRIRHKKIKKHKRRKLRKKMKFIWEKTRFKRNQKKEKLFQAELVSKIKEAEAFDAKEYVKERLNILNKERLPRTYRGEILPTEMIRQFLNEKKAKKEAKRNKPRLTL
ncbi:hypothetical protein P5V15_007020 [Pogonomyrmex californicus]